MNLIDRLKEQEGLRLKPYKCTAGKWTIGYGRNFEDNKFTKEEKTLFDVSKIDSVGITRQIAEVLLANDINSSRKDLSKIIKLENHPEYVIDILIEMVFNLGLTRFMKFKTFLFLIENKQYEKAGYNLVSTLYFKQLYKRVIYMVNKLTKGQ